jgi:hypothetical protein
MKLYNGSIRPITKPQLTEADHLLDFGCGFYATSDRGLATRWAHIQQERANAEACYLNIYEVPKKFSARVVYFSFDEPAAFWLEMTLGCRCGHIYHGIDVARGAIADEYLYQLFVLYEAGLIEQEEILARVKKKAMPEQFAFRTERALKRLRFIESIKL